MKWVEKNVRGYDVGSMMEWMQIQLRLEEGEAGEEARERELEMLDVSARWLGSD